MFHPNFGMRYKIDCQKKPNGFQPPIRHRYLRKKQNMLFPLEKDPKNGGCREVIDALQQQIEELKGHLESEKIESGPLGGVIKTRYEWYSK